MITIIGYIAAVCTTLAFLPQAIKIIRTKNTKDLSLVMYLVLTLGIIMWLLYGISKNDLPIIAANSITLFFTLIILIFKLKYK